MVLANLIAQFKRDLRDPWTAATIAVWVFGILAWLYLAGRLMS